MNKYLEKIAADKMEEKLGLGAQAAAGVAIASGASSRMLGYHNIYHGTTKANADSIRKTGFDPKKGGGSTGASFVHPSSVAKDVYTERSAGKIHVTKIPHVAGMFAGFQSTLRKTPPGFVKARVSDGAWKHFKVDEDVAGPNGSKSIAATTTHRIDPKFISGGKGNKGILAFINKRRLGKYYSSTAGRNRAIRGASMLLGGGSLVANALHKYKNSND